MSDDTHTLSWREVSVIAEKKRLGKLLEQEQNLSCAWEARARQAVCAGDDELVRAALGRKKPHDARAEALQARIAQHQQDIGEMRALLRAIKEKIDTAKRKRPGSLFPRHPRRPRPVVEGAPDPWAAFDRMFEASERKARLAREAAQARARSEAEAQVDREIVAMRKTLDSTGRDEPSSS